MIIVILILSEPVTYFSFIVFLTYSAYGYMNYPGKTCYTTFLHKMDGFYRDNDVIRM